MSGSLASLSAKLPLYSLEALVSLPRCIAPVGGVFREARRTIIKVRQLRTILPIQSEIRNLAREVIDKFLETHVWIIVVRLGPRILPNFLCIPGPFFQDVGPDPAGAHMCSGIGGW